MEGSIVRLGNVDISPAVVDGPPCVFGLTSFAICRRKWIPDGDAVQCPLCCQKFSQIRRKHHCRQCGRVLCNKCCENKVQLPQLGYDQEPQKVCDDCLPVSQLIAKARSSEYSKKEEAAHGLNAMTKDMKNLQKLVEIGGLQTIVTLSKTINGNIKESIAEALHTLTTHTVLHSILVYAGAIKALCALLSSDEKFEKVLIDSISAMMLFCKSEEYKKQAVSEGVLRPLLTLCGTKEKIALLAVTTLSLVADHQENLYALVEKEKDALPIIMNLVHAKDEKMQEISLKILASLSVGTEWHRHRIVQEHYASGKCLVKIFRVVPSNQQVLVNGCCLLGNLAVGEQDQTVLRECLEAVCSLAKQSSVNKDAQIQIARCLSNFAKHKINSNVLVASIPDVFHLYLQSDNATLKLHGVKITMNLLKFDKEHVLPTLRKEHLDLFLSILLEDTQVTTNILACLQKNVQEISRPMTL